MSRLPTHRTPTHPGEILVEDFLEPLDLTQRDVADALHLPYQRINEIVDQGRGVTPGTAPRLARFMGTSASFWLNLQPRWHLYRALGDEAQELQKVQPLAGKASHALAHG